MADDYDENEAGDEFDETTEIIFDDELPLPSEISQYDLTNTNSLMIPTKSRTSRNILSKFEKTRVLCERTEQLRRGAKPYIDLGKYKIAKDNFYYYSIAEIELNEKMLPIIIRRFLHSGLYEDWKLKELSIIYK